MKEVREKVASSDFQLEFQGTLVCPRWFAGVPQDFRGGYFIGSATGDVSLPPAVLGCLSILKKSDGVP